MKSVRQIGVLVLFILWCVPSFAQTAQITATYVNDFQVNLNWTSSTNLVSLAYKRAESTSWTTIPAGNSAGITGGASHEAFGSPGQGMFVLPQGSAAGAYVFRVTECAVHSMVIYDQNPQLLCGPNQPYFNGVFDGAVAQSGSLDLPYQAPTEYTTVPVVLPPLSFGQIRATALNQFGQVRLDWVAPSGYTFIELERTYWNGPSHTTIAPGSDGTPVVTGEIWFSSATYTGIAPSGSVTSFLQHPGSYSYTMRGCKYQSTTQGVAGVKVCSDNIQSSTVSVESLGILNLPPIVSFVSPSSNSTLAVGSATTVNVLATDLSVTGISNTSNQIAKVDFYVATQPGQLIVPAQKVATVTAPVGGQYQYTFSQNLPGDYYLVAVATDTAGATGYAVNNLRVVAPTPSVPNPPNNTQAVDYSRYAVYYGNFDGGDNNLRDVYFHGLPLIIILHGDIATPIRLATPPGFIYLGKADGSYADALPWDMTDGALANCTECTLAKVGEDLVLGDMNADGKADILVLGESDSVSSLLISGTEGATLPQILLEILSTGQTRKPGQAASQTPNFNGNLSESSVQIVNGMIRVNGINQSLAALQQVVSTEGASSATNESISAPTPASLPSPSLTAAEMAEIDSLSSLGGEFRVNESGAATYTVPLALPAGTAGVVPEISLSYSSQSGVGNMGLGWSMSAGSAISRCRQTLQVDGQALPIKFTKDDRFCLDGQRLLLHSGAEYGAIGAVYKPEMDNGSLITSVGGALGHPDYFVMTSKDGSTSTFGAESTTDSLSEIVGRDKVGVQQDPSTRVMTWLISEFKDSVANKIVYNYESSSNYHRLKTVSYGFGDTYNADVVVSFSYIPQRKPDPYFVAGSRFLDNSLLSKVTITDRGEPVREYRISYNANIYVSGSDNFDRVTSIKSCLGEQCSRPLAMDWGFASAGAAARGNGRVHTYVNSIFNAVGGVTSGFPGERITTGATNPVNWRVQNESLRVLTNRTHHSYIESDINGDGLPDLVGLEIFSGDQFELFTKVQTRGGFDISRKDGDLVGDPEAIGGRETPQLIPTDFNADGRMDLAVYQPATKTWRTFFATPKSMATGIPWRLNEVYNFLPSVINDVNSPVDNLRFADVNADGLADALFTKNGQLHVYHLKRKNGQGNEAAETAISQSSTAYEFVSSGTPVAADKFDTYNFGGAFDINEDGRVDVLGAKFTLTQTVDSEESIINPSSIRRPHTCNYTVGFQSMVANGTGGFTPGAEIPVTTASETYVQVTASNHPWVNAHIISKCDLTEFRRRLIGPILTDINEDGLVDLAWAFASPRYPTSSDVEKDPENFFRDISYRLGQENNSFGPPETQNLGVDGVGFEFMDVDLDGDNDLLISGKDDVRWISTWTGSSFNTNTTPHLTALAGRQTRYSDINGDGYLDRSEIRDQELSVTLGRPNSNNVVVRFKTGMGAVTSVAYEPLRDSGRYKRLEGIQTVYSHTIPESDPACVATNYNGECYFYTYPAQPVYVTDASGFYQAINEPFAGVTNATDLNLERFVPAQEMLSAMPVVTRVASSAPTAENGKALAGVDYAYEGLKIQGGGRGFLGFKKLTTTDMQTGVITETEYRQDWPFMGTPLTTLTKTRHGQLLKKSTTTMAIQGIDENNAAAKRELAKTGTKNLGPLVIYTNQAVDTTYDAPASLLTMPDVNNTATLTENKLSEVVTTTTVDGYGNVLTMNVNTSGREGSVWASRQSQNTTNTYYPGEEALRFGRLQSSQVTTSRGTVTSTKTASFTYIGYPGASSDCAAFTQLRGLLCSEQITVSNTAQSVAPAASYHWYDAFGNKIFTRSLSDADGLSRVSPMVEFDSKGRFPVATYDVFNAKTGLSSAVPSGVTYPVPQGAALVKTSEVLLSDKFGNALLSRSQVGSGNWRYSVQATTPMGAIYFKGDSTGAFEETRMQRHVSNYANWCPLGTLYTTNLRKAGGSQATQCHDKLGRAIGSYTLGFNGETIRSRVDFDVLGRTVRSYEPALNAAPSLFTSTTYDVLGRPLVVTHPFNITDAAGEDQTGTLATTQFAYTGLSTTTTVAGYANEPPRTKTEIRNILGELVRVIEMGQRSIGYEYDVQGNLTKTGPVNADGSFVSGLTVEVNYNSLGQKYLMNDPDKGVWKYYYNSFGQLNEQVDFKGTRTISRFDFKGRQTEQEVKPVITTDGHLVRWHHDLGENGLGQVNREVKTNSLGVVEFTRQIGFDALGRPSLTTTTFKGAAANDESHYQRVTYDQFGRVFQTFDAARVGPQFTYNGIQNHYNNFGYMFKVVDATNGGSSPFYTVRAMDARGNVTDMLYGSGETVTYMYHPTTGFMTEIKRTVPTDATIKAFNATWDHLGNLVSRDQDFLGGTVETFKYDQYNRLTRNTLGSTAVNIAYDDVTDNIKNKSDQSASDYQYSTTQRHAVTQVGNRAFQYDANGNMIEERVSGTLRKRLTYTGNDLVKTIEVLSSTVEGSPPPHTSEFFYDSSNSRYKRIDRNSSGQVTTTLYLGSVEKIHYHDGVVEWKRSVGGIVQVTHRKATGVADTVTRHYFHKDHLGSINAITQVSGSTVTIVQAMAFDPWGARRTVTNNVWYPSAMDQSILASFAKAAKPITNRGFTGHEMLDEVGIIHMNGRIYDASLGRFLQADPLIQEPTMVGSLNRYSYTMNNPLNAVDPSGFSWLGKKWGKFWDDVKPFVGAIVAIVLTVYAPWGTGLWANIAYGAVAGAAGAAATGGNILQGALIGGVSAAAFYGVGKYFKGVSNAGCGIGSAGGKVYEFGGNMLSAGQIAGQITAHATVGGVLSEIQGGKFGHGFVSAGLTKGTSFVDGGGVVVRALAAGTVGGTVSRMTGGKFANGFQTGAFQSLFNEAVTKGTLGVKEGRSLNPFKIIGEEFPKWFKSQVIPKFTIYAGGDATFVPGAGPVGAIGSYFTTDNGISTWETGYSGGDMEFGSYTSVGGSFGLDADASLGIGLTFGDLTNFQGSGSSLAFDFGPASLDLNFNDAAQWVGFRFSVNTPLPGISTGVSATTTRAY